MLVALVPAPGKAMGTGGLILWPLFGATNQLLAGLAFMVVVFYLWRRNKPVLFAALPMLLMLLLPAWALLYQMFNVSNNGWLWAANAAAEAGDWNRATGQYLLFGFGVMIMGLQIWMVVEGFLLLPRAKGVLEEALPPLPDRKLATSGGRSC